MKRLIVGLILVFACSGQTQPMCAPALPSDVCKFETKVFTETDFKNTSALRQIMVEFKMLFMAHAKDSTFIRDHILTLGDQIVEESYNLRAPKHIIASADGKENLLKMLGRLRAWEKKNGQILPLDWQAPDGLLIGVAALDRSYDISTDKLRYGISFFAPLTHALEVEQFKISQFGGSVVIDRSAGIGSWDEGRLPYMDYHFFSASSIDQDAPMADGLYLISMKVKGQKTVDGWFFLHGTSGTSPAIQAPQVNEVFHVGNPTFRFQDFRSGSILPSDSRKISLSVFHEGNNSKIWGSSVINSKNKISMTVGRETNQVGVMSLNPGLYRLNLAFEERSYFGELTIGRFMRTTIPFRIAK